MCKRNLDDTVLSGDTCRGGEGFTLILALQPFYQQTVKVL